MSTQINLDSTDQCMEYHLTQDYLHAAKINRKYFDLEPFYTNLDHDDFVVESDAGIRSTVNLTHLRRHNETHVYLLPNGFTWRSRQVPSANTRTLRAECVHTYLCDFFVTDPSLRTWQAWVAAAQEYRYIASADGCNWIGTWARYFGILLNYWKTPNERRKLARLRAKTERSLTQMLDYAAQGSPLDTAAKLHISQALEKVHHAVNDGYHRIVSM